MSRLRKTLTILGCALVLLAGSAAVRAGQPESPNDEDLLERIQALEAQNELLQQLVESLKAAVAELGEEPAAESADALKAAAARFEGGGPPYGTRLI